MEENKIINIIDKKDGYIYIKNMDLEKISKIINKKIIDETYIKIHINELSNITHKLIHSKYICYYIDYSNISKL
mgnify:CR=1 FL=1